MTKIINSPGNRSTTILLNVFSGSHVRFSTCVSICRNKKNI